MKRIIFSILFLFVAITMIAQSQTSFIVADKNGSSQLVQSLIFQQEQYGDRTSWGYRYIWKADGTKRGNIEDLGYIARTNSTLATGSVDDVTTMLEGISGNNQADAEAVAAMLKENTNVEDAQSSSDGLSLIVKYKDTDVYSVYPVKQLKDPFGDETDEPSYSRSRAPSRKVSSQFRTTGSRGKVAVFNYFSNQTMTHKTQNKILEYMMYDLNNHDFGVEYYPYEEFTVDNLRRVIASSVYNPAYTAVIIMTHGFSNDDKRRSYFAIGEAYDRCNSDKNVKSFIEDEASENDEVPFSARFWNEGFSAIGGSGRYDIAVNVNKMKLHDNVILYMGSCDAYKYGNLQGTSIGWDGPNATAQAHVAVLFYHLMNGKTMDYALDRKKNWNIDPVTKAAYVKSQLRGQWGMFGGGYTLIPKTDSDYFRHGVWYLRSKTLEGPWFTSSKNCNVTFEMCDDAGGHPDSYLKKIYIRVTPLRSDASSEIYTLKKKEDNSYKQVKLQFPDNGVYVITAAADKEFTNEIRMSWPIIVVKAKPFKENGGEPDEPNEPDEDEAYALYNNGTLSFYCDGDRSLRSGETYDMPDYWSSPEWHRNSSDMSRYIEGKNVKRVVFDSSFAKARPKCTMAWFSDMSSITEIEGLQYLNTSEVTCMSEMFYGCSNLKTLDVSHFNTSKVTYMGYMFDECSSLVSLDVSHFNTSKVTSMMSMFRMCSSLTKLDINNFDTSNTTEMKNMFAECSNLTSLNVSNFDTSKTTDMSSMFYGCSRLSELDVSGFNTSQTTQMSSMFYGCSRLLEIDVSNFNTSNVYNMTWMFGGCSSLTSIDISSFDISSLVDEYEENALQGMFFGCNNLKTIKCGVLWNVKNIAYSSDMFSGCACLVGGKGTNYDSNHTDAEYARIDGGPGKPGYFTDVNGSQPNVPAEAVDLGLPSGTLWASCNVGATKPEEVGGYYAWGETEEKKVYEWSNYSLCSGKEGTCHDIGENISGTQYDVAHVKWGANWRMPTIDEWQEVIVNCTNQVVTLNGVKGLRLTSRKNGKSIFLPFTGCRWDSGTYYPDNIYCWLSNKSSKGNDFANYLQYREGMGIGSGRDFERYIGLPVRPVYK